MVYIQVNNWRTVEQQFTDENGVAIDLTGATGNLVMKSPKGFIYNTAITPGKVDDPTKVTDGWCWATFKGIDMDGDWSEQMQLVLPAGSEPLNGGIDTFKVSGNLVTP